LQRDILIQFFEALKIQFSQPYYLIMVGVELNIPDLRYSHVIVKSFHGLQ